MNEGMVFASDSRTNAGVDQIASFKKMRTYNNGTDRVIVTLTSGNLSITQSVVNLIEQLLLKVSVHQLDIFFPHLKK